MISIVAIVLTLMAELNDLYCSSAAANIYDEIKDSDQYNILRWSCNTKGIPAQLSFLSGNFISVAKRPQ